MVGKKQKLLIVEDDLEIAEMLDAYFRVQGYDVKTVNWGKDAINACSKVHPNLIILDIRLPDMNGFKVARILRETRRTETIPIIFLTEKRRQIDKIQGLKLGVEDYITKPFDVQELRLRVKNVLKRKSKGVVNNPITGLPEGPLVYERLREILGKSDWALILISLQNLNSFREQYGFIASDDVLRAVGLIIKHAVRKKGNVLDFVGHLKADQFLVVTKPSLLKSLTSRIKTRLDKNMDFFYPIDDQDRVNRSSEPKLTWRMNVLQSDDGNIKDIEGLKRALLKPS